MNVHDLVAQIKVMYLAAFSDGGLNDEEKDTINAKFLEYQLKGDAAFISKRLALKTKMELEDDRIEATDDILIDLSPIAEDQERAHQLMNLFVFVAECDGPMNYDERMIAHELADALDLDIEYYISE